ncbi:MAG: tripartite tricarboxylate transporter permease [Candidatus Aenigmarchaeota archaeon]|nr:tripartite tricarboxylate transporter permease [Candidatus Aenigmarchaeota archaeon]
MLELFAALALGILAGTVAGIIPGLHPNMIVLAVPAIAALAEPMAASVFLAALGVANSVTSFLPSIFLGAPDDNALAALPGHRMMMRGQGYDAIKLAVSGCVAAAALLVLLIPVLYYTMPAAIAVVAPYTHMLVAAIAVYMLVGERLPGFIVFALAAVIGVLSLRLPVDGTLILFPMMSGFFGIPSLMASAAEMRNTDAAISSRSVSRGIVSGVAGGITSGFLPGVGTSQIASLFSTSKDDHAFLAASGAIATANIIVSVIALSLIEKARSGVAVAIGQLGVMTNETLLAVIFASLASAAGASLIALWMAKRIPFSILPKAAPFAALFIALLTFLFCNVYGLLVLAAAAATGIYAIKAGAKRGLMMSSLMIPVILFYVA